MVANNPSNANIAKVGRMLAALRRPGDFICTILIENINKHWDGEDIWKMLLSPVPAQMAEIDWSDA